MTPQSRALALFFAMLHVLAVLSMRRGGDERIAEQVVVISIVPLVLGLSYLLARFARGLSWLDVWILIYAAWSVVSVGLYFQPGNPSGIGAYAYGLYHFVLPIACYFAAKSVPRADHSRLLGALVLLNAASLAYGVYLHLARPDYYLAFLTIKLTPQGATQEWQYYARLQSYLGSTSVGYMGAVSLVLATLATPRVKRWLPVLVPLFVGACALSLQRASIIGCVLALGYLALLARGHVMLRLLGVGAVAVAIFYGAARLEARDVPFTDILKARVTTQLAEGLAAFMSDRGYAPGTRYLSRFPLGVGLGGTSSAAQQAGLVSRGEVADANFMRIAADLGLPGALFFLILLAAAFWTAGRSRHRGPWTTFLAIHVGIMLSTNVLDSYYLSHSFWLLLGVIDRDGDPDAAAGEMVPIDRPPVLVPKLAHR